MGSAKHPQLTTELSGSECNIYKPEIKEASVWSLKIQQTTNKETE